MTIFKDNLLSKRLISAVILIIFLALKEEILAEGSVTIALDPVVSGLSSPVYITHAGDGSGRLFIVEQAGRILVYQNDNILTPPFLDIRSRVTSGGEMGLLSVAFHPDYKNNRRFFVNYTHRRPNLKTFIAEYQTSASNPNIADITERVILTIDQPFENHKGGQLQFGPDGYLYIGMGDGGSGGDPFGNGQNKNSLLGKLLRIDIDSALPYAVPVDNPFVNGVGRGEIWAYGLRNPWRFSFDRANGRLFLADVGQDAIEEVDLIERGGNYGWNIMEGTHCYTPPTGCDPTGLKLPISEYDHSLGTAVIGGYVYRGRQYPNLFGAYLFGDYGSSRIWSLRETNRGAWTRMELLRPGFNISSFGEDQMGEIYVANYSQGSIHRIRVTTPQPTENQILIPSAARSDRFISLVSILNRDSTSNEVFITSRNLEGWASGSLRVTLAPGGFYRTSDILGALDLPPGSFGPVSIDSTNGKRLAAVSEVASTGGTAGFFSGQLQSAASTERILAEVVDTGEMGMAGTFRTNLGLNNLSAATAHVQVTLVNSLGVPLGSQSFSVPSQGMVQVNGIIRSILGAAGATGVNGYLRLVSDQPIHAWASKIDNGTDDPSLEVAIGQELSETGLKLLIPSVSSTNRFRSLLVAINREDEPNEVILTARDVNGNVIGTLSRMLPARGFYRSLDVLAEMGAPLGSFGPLTLESINGKLLSAISEVRSAEGTAGFFSAVSPATATLQRVIAEIVDSGDRGIPGTFRTNLGINNLGPVTARVTLQLFDQSGEMQGNALTIAIPTNGMVQIDNILRSPGFGLARRPNAVYVKITSDQPVHAWASKINNGTDDPSIVMAVP